jgi:hypothetical protein
VPFLTDLDGDGDLDLVVGETGGGLNFYRNTTPARVPPTPFALVEPATDADLDGRERTRFEWEPSFAAAGGEAQYELRLSPSPDAPPTDWTILPAAASRLDLQLWSTPFRFLPEVWWTVVATDGCTSAPVPEWRRATHSTIDLAHQELPDGSDAAGHPGPRDLRLAITNAFPSPSAGATTIDYTLPARGHVRVSVHDLPGRRVAVLRDGEQSAGRHREVWNGAASGGGPVSAGIYVIRIEQAGEVVSRRIARLR